MLEIDIDFKNMEKIIHYFFKKYYYILFNKKFNNYFLISFIFKTYLNNFGIINYKINKKI